MSNVMKETIEDSPLFKHLDEDWHRRLIEASEVRTASKGEVLVEEGSSAGALFVVVRGSVRVWTEADGDTVELKRLGPGAYFGEVSLLGAKEATATVEAASETVELVAVDGGVIAELVESDDKVRGMLEGVTLARARDTIGKVLE
ncbi:MAG: Crp/Fnr family transcriptional regulator [Persicimonas sp.]